ncbi:hypothetical protein HID58_018652 [Brassica napus]|uniref:Zinc knuckle CX2CX4HX4C domain-containing protein n=1 Tax=Brassica napus TaxID=3708 RepID=A0ABQ8DAM0_BRANA|nr:hypothetical protein HID58_018652 [Brassica napus]
MILSKVATTSICDFGSQELLSTDEVNAVRTFMLKCYQLGNPEAIYLRDMYEYFILHLLDEGRETIHLAGERGCLLAKYVDGMLNLAFSVDHRGLDHNYPGFTREYVDRMYHMITSWALFGHWGYDKPEMIMSLLERIDPNGAVSSLPVPAVTMSIGRALGEVDTVDVENGRVRVVVNADEPLQFERKAGYANGDIIKVSLSYEELHRYCFTCKRISHEEGTCPELSPEQREANRLVRLESKEKEELAAREAFSAPFRGRDLHRGFENHAWNTDNHPRFSREMESDKRRQEHPQRREERARPGQAQRTEHGDLRSKILSKREDIAKNVWNRIDHSYGGRNPRDRERYHPYNRDKYEESKHSSRDSGNRSVRGHHGDSVSSSSWRIKGSSPDTRGRNLDQTNKDQHYEHRRMDLSSKSTRNSPDSQRTISESHRYDRGDGAGRRYHSPRQQPRMEWRPTREPGKRRDEQMALSPNQRNVREIARETEDERRRMLKGKAIEANAGDKETNLDTVRAASGILKIFDTVQTEFPGNQVITEKEKEFVTSPERVISLRSPIETGAPSLNRPNLEELDKPTDNEQEMTEEELKEFEEQYASVQLEMDEEMLDNDDLLDETRVEETMVEETMAPEYQTAGQEDAKEPSPPGKLK